MNSYENEVFEFGTNPNEETSNFNYQDISGLGESNYENEDLFNDIPPVNETTNVTQPINTDLNTFDVNNFDYSITSDKSLNEVEMPTYEAPAIETPIPEIPVNNDNSQPTDVLQNYIESYGEQEEPVEQPSVENMEPVVPEWITEQPKENIEVNNVPLEEANPIENYTEPVAENVQEVSVPVENTPIPEMQTVETIPELQPIEEVNSNPESSMFEENPFEIPAPEQNNEMPEMKIVETTEETSPTIEEVTEEPQEIAMSETPIEDLQKLTEYEDEKIESTDINSLFDKLSVNVKDASDIFIKNTNLKQKIDSRFEELKGLQNELENSRRKQMEEIDKYRDEVLDKLTEKKAEIERRLNVLKDLQATLEKEKTEFEEYKRKEQANITKVQKEVQSAYDERREELEHIEDVLRKQKDALDEERNQLSLDKIQYEADKNDLANNLLKFNQIVNSFTNGIEMKPEE